MNLIADFRALLADNVTMLRDLEAWERWDVQRIQAEYDERGRRRKHRLRIGPSPMEQNSWSDLSNAAEDKRAEIAVARTAEPPPSIQRTSASAEH